MSSAGEPTPAARTRERAWWLRALAVLQSPAPVFAALRDDDEEDQQARAEPLVAIVFLAAIAAVLATPTAGRLLDDPAIDGVLIPVLAVFTGGIYAIFGYFVLGGAVFFGSRAAGSLGTYRRARHLLGFALVPLALSLVVLWPIRLALFGGDSFRTGGSDRGTAGEAVAVLQLAFAAWSLALLVVGVRAVHGWSWARAAAALAGAVAAIGGVVLLFAVT